MTEKQALALPKGSTVGIIGPPARFFNLTSRRVMDVTTRSGIVVVHLESKTGRREDDYLAGAECVVSLAEAQAWRNK